MRAVGVLFQRVCERGFSGSARGLAFPDQALP